MVHDEVQITCLKQHTEKISNEVLKAFGQAEEFLDSDVRLRVIRKSELTGLKPISWSAMTLNYCPLTIHL